MSTNNEQFRNEFASKLAAIMPPEQLRDALKAFDLTQADYDISRKPLELANVGGFPEVAKMFLASKAIGNVSNGTLKQYKYKLSHFFNTVNKSFNDISANDIRIYLYNFKQERNISDRYLECVRVTLNSFFTWLVENDYLLKNPCAKVESIKFEEKQREPLTPYELEVLRWNTADRREKALVDFFFSTGCRVSECAEVRLSDVDFESRSVLIRHGKGNKSRTVYFNAECELSLRKYLETRKDTEDALFVSTRNPHPITAHALQDIIKKVSERANMHVFPHKLRHTFATSGLRGGMPLEKLQCLMGHSKPQTTLIYAKLDQSDIQHEHQRIYA